MRPTPYRTVILGSGSELPSKVMTNTDFEKLIDTSDEWITTRTGIKERREKSSAGPHPSRPDGSVQGSQYRTVRLR